MFPPPNTSRAARLRFLEPECRHGTGQLRPFDDEIDLVARQHLFVGVGHDDPVLPRDPDDGDQQVRKDLGQLAQRRLDQRAVLAASHADEPHQPVDQGNHLERAGHLKTSGDGARHFDFRRDDDVDGQILAREQIRVDRAQIALVTDSRDLDRHVEQRMRHLARHHVDLVVLGDGDQDVGVLGLGTFQRIRMRGMADDSLDVQAVADAPDQFRRLVDDRDVVVLHRQIARDIGPDLSGAAYDDLHETEPLVQFIGRLAVRRRRPECPGT